MARGRTTSFTIRPYPGGTPDTAGVAALDHHPGETRPAWCLQVGMTSSRAWDRGTDRQTGSLPPTSTAPG